MNQITKADLERVVMWINEATNSPTEPYTKQPDGTFRANIGNYHLDGAYGGWALARMSSNGGGISDVFRVGHVTKRELLRLMRAYLEGIEVARR